MKPLNLVERFEKLQFGSAKCKKMHVGKCQDLTIDSSEEIKVENYETGNSTNDKYNGDDAL